jgi:hypothetical protein
MEANGMSDIEHVAIGKQRLSGVAKEFRANGRAA